MRTSRRTGVAALLLATLSLGPTGCLSSSRYQREDGPGCAGCGAGPMTSAGARIGGPPASGAMPATIAATPAGKPLKPGDIQRTGFLEETGPEMMVRDKERGPYVGGPAHPVEGVAPPQPGCPTELAKVSHPPYTVAPPDILVIDAVRMIPRPPYRIEPLEVVLVNVTDTLPGQPISGAFVVSPEGAVNLGYTYGSVPVVGLTLDQAQNAIKSHLGSVLKAPQVTIALAQFRGMQQVRGQHLVRPDGTISLGTYGAVYVAGMTLGQVKCVVEKHLSEYMLNPQVSVDVFAYNSKFYYVILDGAGLGQQVVRIPSTGNETVLDAIATIQGLAPVSSKKRIWLARPSPVHMGCNQILPIDWNAITQGGSTGTNYQLFPGDRIYVSGDPLICFDNNLAKWLAPVERVLGVTLLGASTWQTIRNTHNNGFNNGNGVVVVP
ncbi:MAG: polysaccharide biosynthesis/export family protein [Gemmataceae bacterium]